MTELLFGLTVIFIAYVLWEVFKTVSGGDTSGAGHAAAPVASAPPVSHPPQPVTPAPSVSPAPAPEAEKATLLRNPATGETSPVPTNYRFAKKWIKEALVSEGLLSKVYKNSELVDETAGKVKEALDKFRTLEKYQA
jgi:hypothetical protein